MVLGDEALVAAFAPGDQSIMVEEGTAATGAEVVHAFNEHPAAHEVLQRLCGATCEHRGLGER